MQDFVGGECAGERWRTGSAEAECGGRDARARRKSECGDPRGFKRGCFCVCVCVCVSRAAREAISGSHLRSPKERARRESPCGVSTGLSSVRRGGRTNMTPQVRQDDALNLSI